MKSVPRPLKHTKTDGGWGCAPDPASKNIEVGLPTVLTSCGSSEVELMKHAESMADDNS